MLLLRGLYIFVLAQMFLNGFSHLRLQCACLYSSKQLGVTASGHSQALKTKGRGVQTILSKEKRISQV